MLLEEDFCYRRIRWSGSPLYNNYNIDIRHRGKFPSVPLPVSLISTISIIVVLGEGVHVGVVVGRWANKVAIHGSLNERIWFITTTILTITTNTIIIIFITTNIANTGPPPAPLPSPPLDRNFYRTDFWGRKQLQDVVATKCCSQQKIFAPSSAR